MKNIIPFLSLSLLLTGCATLVGGGWGGQSFDNYVMRYGIPASQYELQDGNIAYSFQKACEYDSSKIGETLVVVGSDNLIQSISTPTRCPYYYETDEYKYKQEMERISRENHREQISRLEAKLRNMGNGYSQEKALKLAESAVEFEESSYSQREQYYNRVRAQRDSYCRTSYELQGQTCQLLAKNVERAKKDLDEQAAKLKKAKYELKKAQQDYKDWERQKRDLEREIRELKAMHY